MVLTEMMIDVELSDSSFLSILCNRVICNQEVVSDYFNYQEWDCMMLLTYKRRGGGSTKEKMEETKTSPLRTIV